MRVEIQQTPDIICANCDNYYAHKIITTFGNVQGTSVYVEVVIGICDTCLYDLLNK